MLVEISEFKEVIEKIKIIDRDNFNDIFYQMTSDENLFKEMDEGFTPYITLDVNKRILSVTNVRAEGPGLDFLNKKHTLAVKAFHYLKEVLAH